MVDVVREAIHQMLKDGYPRDSLIVIMEYNKFTNLKSEFDMMTLDEDHTLNKLAIDGVTVVLGRDVEGIKILHRKTDRVPDIGKVSGSPELPDGIGFVD